MEREKLVSMVEGLKRGDDAAFDMLYRNFQSDIYYFILQKTDNDRQLSEDLTQETFIEVLESIGTLNEPVAFVSWIHTVASRKCSAYFRKRHELTADEEEDGYSDFSKLEEDREEFIPGAAMETLETRQIIRDLLRDIPDDQREALILRYFRELSLQEIAEIQGVNEGTVKSRLHYAKKCLKKNIEEYEKKNDIKLHSVGVVPVLLWLFKQYRVQEKLSQVKTAGQMLNLGEEAGVAAAVATGGTAAATTAGTVAAVTAGVTGAETAGAAAAAVGTSAAAQTAVGTGLVIAGKAITAKVAAGILAAVVAIGGTGAGVAALVNSGKEPEPTVSQEVIAGETQATEVMETTETVETEPGHTHTYEIVEVLLPNCTDQGCSTYLCDCGHSYQGDYKNALGHDFAETDRVEPAVGKDGYIEYTCLNCSLRNRDVLPALTEEGEHYHVKQQQMQAATCTTDGYVRETCTECGEELRYEAIPALDHEMVETGRLEPAIGVPGYIEYTCTRCGEKLVENLPGLSEEEHLHQNVTESNAAGCTTEGSVRTYCTSCGEVFRDEVTPALGHAPAEEISRVDPQAGVAGYVIYRCSRCNEQYQEVLDALPEDSTESTECEHDWDYYSEYTDVLVYEDRTCRICGKYEVTYQQDNAGCEHNWSYHETVFEDTIHEMRTCDICGQVEKVSEKPNPCAHQWIEYTQENVIGEVHTYRECTVCGYVVQLAD